MPWARPSGRWSATAGHIATISTRDREVILNRCKSPTAVGSVVGEAVGSFVGDAVGDAVGACQRDAITHESCSTPSSPSNELSAPMSRVHALRESAGAKAGYH
jgi:hypothetical protein